MPEHTLLCVDNETNDPLLESVENFWNTECLGINPDETSVYDTFLDDLQYNVLEKRYEVGGLPWKLDPVTAGLPDNFTNSKRRLMFNIKSMKKKPDILTEYHAIIKTQLQQGVIEESPEEITKKFVHYLPRRAVVRDKKTSSRVRIVYDGSAKVSKDLPSLNDCLLKGPSLNPLIIEILLRFRLYPVAFVCDVQKAFLQINIKKEDRDMLRFLWVDDPFKDDTEIVTYRFCRVLFGLTSSPFLLNGTLREHFKKYIDTNPQIVNSLMKSLFGDDFAGGGQNDVDVYRKYTCLIEILKEASFNVHKFFSNDKKLNEKFRKLMYSSHLQNSDAESKTSTHNVLGVTWDYKSDELMINFGNIV